MISLLNIASPATFHLSQKIQPTVVERVVRATENLFKNLFRRGLNIETMLYGLYAMRIPIFYLERYIHDQKSKSVLEKFSDAFFVAADVVGTVSFFTKYPIRQLGSLAAKIGSGPFGVIMKKVPLPPVLSGFRGLAFLCHGAHSVRKLYRSDCSKAEKRQAWIDVVSAVAEVAYSILFVAGCSFAPLMVPLSAITLSMMVISLSHSTITALRATKKK